jgi:hypothetical protein
MKFILTFLFLICLYLYTQIIYILGYMKGLKFLNKLYEKKMDEERKK